MKSNKRGLTKSCDLEDIEKCLQVQSYDEEGLLKYQNTITPCESPTNYKEKTKKWHNTSKRRKHMEIGNHVLFCKSRMESFPEKLKNRWPGPFTMSQVLSHGVIELINN